MMPLVVTALIKAAPSIRIEVMSPALRKIHLGDDRALHHFTRGDDGEEYHSHPWSFTSEVLHGGYAEDIVVSLYPFTVLEKRRLPGTTHQVEANHIHRITRLLGEDCWTLVIAGPAEREVQFYRHREGGVQSRRWDEAWQ
ncbi:hypothetical protein [Sphingomonas sp. PAMC 26621]|uniref:hypothetical protein n=1 Tax=Sphingomonas sp. PAMC 26621 TaxID=1112213 RepID=UPI000289BCEC|nr:hypothetical protein [Sphingomonas sp. PAMC 26621]